MIHLGVEHEFFHNNRNLCLSNKTKYPMNNLKLQKLQKLRERREDQKSTSKSKVDKWFFWDSKRRGPGYGFWIFIIGMSLLFLVAVSAAAYVLYKQDEDYQPLHITSKTLPLSNDDIPNKIKQAGEKIPCDKHDIFRTDDKWTMLCSNRDPTVGSKFYEFVRNEWLPQNQLDPTNYSDT